MIKGPSAQSDADIDAVISNSTQFLGLGLVLITTMAFGAAFGGIAARIKAYSRAAERNCRGMDAARGSTGGATGNRIHADAVEHI